MHLGWRGRPPPCQGRTPTTKATNNPLAGNKKEQARVVFKPRSDRTRSKDVKQRAPSRGSLKSSPSSLEAEPPNFTAPKVDAPQKIDRQTV